VVVDGLGSRLLARLAVRALVAGAIAGLGVALPASGEEGASGAAEERGLENQLDRRGGLAASGAGRQRILDLVGRSESAQALAVAIEDEPAVAIAVLRAANSDGAPGGAGSVPEAVDALPSARLAEATLAVPVLDVLAADEQWGESVGRFRLHALSVRDIAGRLANEVSLDPARLRALALLHDIGRPALQALGPTSRAHEAPGTPEQRLAAERDDLGRDHADAGADLLDRWGLPADFTQAVRGHHRAVEGEAGALRLADALSHYGQQRAIDISGVVELSERLGLARDTLTELMLELPGVLLAGQRAAPNPLSARELDILRLLAEGLTSQQVAERLGLSSSTVNNHLHRIYRRLDVADRSQALLRARDQRWM
jgi:putative nucleotidyltransferase with HDIG domain